MMEINELHHLFLQSHSISIDTRNIKPNSFFIALKGVHFDGNTFASQALEKGASFVIIDDKRYFIDGRTILVENALSTLQELAKYHRNYLGLPIIALTGSNGKTTTKELINVVLSEGMETKATSGNLNNHIGVPLTLLSFTKSTAIGIVEMGANHLGEIAFLCSIARPDFGYITNFGKAHLEGFGSYEGVIQAKTELYDYLRLHNKVVFINRDDTLQLKKAQFIKNVSFSIKDKNATIFVSQIGADPFVLIYYNNLIIQSHLIGNYNINNISAAIAIGVYFGISDISIKKAIENYFPTNNRSQFLTKNTNKIILDAYNANPSSMKGALENFFSLKMQNKIVVLGDMFELGEYSHIEHQNIVTQVSEMLFLNCFFVGKYFYSVKIDKEKCNFFETFDDFAIYFKHEMIQNATILIKGSRGIAIERTLDLLP